MNLIEIALNNYTDYFLFEKLALEVMAFESYPNIRKMGGFKDNGVDAYEKNVYCDDDDETRIFQFTVQVDTKGKIENTAKKLYDNKIDYSELILVTSQQVNDIDQLRKAFKKKHKKNLEIYDYTTFEKQLIAHNNLFLSYFPDIKSQINSDFYSDNIFSNAAEDQLEMSMIKSTILYSVYKKGGNEMPKQSLFDKSILSILASERKDWFLTDIIDFYLLHFHKKIDENQVSASIERLGDLVKKNSEKSYTISDKTKRSITSKIAEIERKTNAFSAEIIAKIRVVANEMQISLQDENRIVTNIKQALNLLFKMYGCELAININTLSSECTHQDELSKRLKDGLTPDLGEIVLYVLGRTLANLTKEQASLLSSWSHAFVASQIMKLDPMLSNFQRKTLQNKTFILDTDYVLNCLVDYGHHSDAYKCVLNELVSIGCKIYVPDAVINEVIKHAEFAHRNYNYFKSTFETIDNDIIYGQMTNVFVQDYFMKYTVNVSEYAYQGFRKYIANFYEPSDSYNFMKEVMEDKLPKGVLIGDNTLIENAKIDKIEFKKLAEAIYQETIMTVKAAYRSDDENVAIAETDSLLYLSAHNLNKGMPHDDNDRLLDGNIYLLTNSTRAARCAKSLGCFSSVVVKPEMLLAILQEIGLFTVGEKTIVNLLDNPFLAEVADESWNEIKSLADMGVVLKGESLPRLRRKLKKTVHTLLTKKAEMSDSSEKSNFSESDDVKDYIKIATEIHKAGYSMVPEAERLIAKFEEMETTNEGNKKINEQLKTEIAKFGKRRANYLNRQNSEYKE